MGSEIKKKVLLLLNNMEIRKRQNATAGEYQFIFLPHRYEMNPYERRMFGRRTVFIMYKKKRDTHCKDAFQGDVFAIWTSGHLISVLQMKVLILCHTGDCYCGSLVKRQLKTKSSRNMFAIE